MKKVGLGSIFVQTFGRSVKKNADKSSCAKALDALKIKNKKREVIRMPTDRLMDSPFYFEESFLRPPQTARRASTITIRDALMAGRAPPTNPMIRANPMPI
jgi:hypothetical protein